MTVPTHRLLLLFALALSLAACGDSDGGMTDPTPMTTSTTSIPAQAQIQLEILSAGALVSGQGNAFGVSIRITESGGVGANINFARLEVFRATGELEERQEVGAGQIIAGVGDNRLEANTSEEATVTFFFRATVKTGRTLTFTMGFTDDNSNTFEVATSFIFG